MADKSIPFVSTANNTIPTQLAANFTSSKNFTDIQSPTAKVDSDTLLNSAQLSSKQIKDATSSHHTNASQNIIVKIDNDDPLDDLQNIAIERSINNAKSTKSEIDKQRDVNNIRRFQAWFTSEKNKGDFGLDAFKEAIESSEELAKEPESSEEVATAKADMKHLTETAADLIQNFKKFMSENLTTAKKAAEDKLSKTNNPEERAKIKKEIADINAAQKKIENIENTKDMSPKQVLAALKEDKVLAKALDTLLKVGTKDEKTGKVSLSENQIRDLNTKLFGVVFKDDEKLRSSIADILYRNPKTAEEFFGFKTAKDFLQTVQENIKAEKKKDEETKAKEKREEEAQTKRDSAKQAEARIAENKRQEKIKETIRSNDSRAVAAYKTGNFSVTTLLAHGYTLTEILNEVSMGGLSGVGTEARRQVIALLKSKGKELKGDETLSKLIDLITAS